MTEAIAGLGFSVDSSSLTAGASGLAQLSDQARTFAKSLDQLAAAGEPMDRVLADLQKSGAATGAVFDELSNRYAANARAAQSAAQQISQAWAGVQFPGGQGGGSGGLFSAAGAGASGYAAVGAGVSQIAQQAQQAGTAWRAYAQEAQLAQQATQGVATATAQVASGASAAATQVGYLGRTVQALVSAGGTAGAFAGGLGGPLAFITGGLAVHGIEDTAAALGRLTASVVENGEAWLLAEQRIQFALASTEKKAQETRQQLLDQSKGVSFDSTVTTFQRIAPPLQQGGLDVTSIEQVTKALQELAVVSGTTPARSTRAIYEISEAFSTGKLSGQQFRTAILDMPAILQALGEATGKTQAQLIEMGHAGELSGGMIADSLLRYLPTLDAQFQSVGNTVSRAAQDVGNAWTETTGKVAEQTGLIGNLAGAYETFAGFIRSDAFKGALSSVAQLISDVSKGISDSERQISAFTAGVANLRKIADPTAGTQAPPPGQDTAARIADLQQQRSSAAAQSAAIARPGSGFSLPILGDRAAAADRKVAELDAEIASLRTELERQVGASLFQVSKNASGGPIGIVNPGGEGDAASLASRPVPSSLPETTQKIIEQQKTLVDLQQHLNDLRVAEAGLVKDAPGAEEKLAGLAKDEAETVAKITTEKKKQQEEDYSRSRDIPIEQGRQELASVQNVNKGLDERKAILAQIASAKDVASFARDAGDMDLFHRSQQVVRQESERLAELDQRRKDSLLQQREALLGQADAEARLAADEEKNARLRRTAPGASGPVLATRDQADQAQDAASKRYFTGIEQEAAKRVAGASEVQKVEEQISAVDKGMIAHVETRRVGEQELVRLAEERGRLLEKENEQIQAAISGDQKRLAVLRLQNQRLQSGGGEIEARIQDAGEQAEGQFPDLTYEQQRANPGAQVQRAAAREEAGDLARSNELLKVRKEAIQALGDPQDRFVEEQSRLNEELKAGVITLDQYTAALRRRQVEADKASRQQRIQDLVATGEPGSGVSAGGQVANGAQAAALQWVEQYGNAAQATQSVVTEMANAGVDALASLAQGTAVNVGEIVSSLGIMVTKMLISIAVARALQAALGGGQTPDANLGGVGYQAPTTGEGAFAASGGTGAAYGYHVGGEVGAGGNGSRPRVFPQSAVDRAPRYHTGSGTLQPDERLAVLQTGERVLSRQENRAYSSTPVVNMPVTINNQAGARVSSRQDRGPDGQPRLQVLLERQQENAVRSGRMDGAMASRFGVGRALV